MHQTINGWQSFCIHSICRIAAQYTSCMHMQKRIVATNNTLKTPLQSSRLKKKSQNLWPEAYFTHANVDENALQPCSFVVQT